jgi:hypothetical protein
MPSFVWARASLLTVLSAHAGRTLAPSDPAALTADSTVCPEDCSTHGSCRENRCFCLAGWLGETCSERDCSPCINGKCIDGECRCDEGFTGSACRWAACANDCSGHGACVKGRCLCADGWTGPDCEAQSLWSVASCPNDCAGHGACFSGRCQCHATWSGEDCSVAAAGTGALAALETPCASPYATGVGALPCGFNGRCKGVACECFAGWRGARCEIGICPRDCSGQGACVGGVCACRDGWRGEDCTTPPRLPARSGRPRLLTPRAVHGRAVRVLSRVARRGLRGGRLPRRLPWPRQLQRRRRVRMRARVGGRRVCAAQLCRPCQLLRSRRVRLGRLLVRQRLGGGRLRSGGVPERLLQPRYLRG